MLNNWEACINMEEEIMEISNLLNAINWWGWVFLSIILILHGEHSIFIAPLAILMVYGFTPYVMLTEIKWYFRIKKWKVKQCFRAILRKKKNGL